MTVNFDVATPTLAPGTYTFVASTDDAADGEGVVGLTRSFMFAGARSVVAALWDVSGEATARFMGDYYARLAAAPGPDRALELARVKRAMIARGIVLRAMAGRIRCQVTSTKATQFPLIRESTT